jgi:glycosyltransferase involved in cell wall biosynthesis
MNEWRTPSSDFKTSVIVSTYNQLEFLDKVLSGYEQQSVKDFELIVADDGSGAEIKNLVDSYVKRGILHLKHVWHEDRGFRKNRVLNMAIMASASDYLVFTDGDCIPHKHFVKDHILFRAENRVIAGRRVNLSEKCSSVLSPLSISKGKLDRMLPYLFFDSVMGESRDVEKGIRLPIAYLSRKLGKFNKGVLGCNFSLFKKAMIEINGFDTRYELPCVGEDSDPEFRLKLLGYEVFSPRFRAIQYHLYHKKQSRSQVDINMKFFNDTINFKIAVTKHGLKQQQGE